jgi:hypothetical protein
MIGAGDSAPELPPPPGRRLIARAPRRTSAAHDASQRRSKPRPRWPTRGWAERAPAPSSGSRRTVATARRTFPAGVGRNLVAPRRPSTAEPARRRPRATGTYGAPWACLRATSAARRCVRNVSSPPAAVAPPTDGTVTGGGAGTTRTGGNAGAGSVGGGGVATGGTGSGAGSGTTGGGGGCSVGVGGGGGPPTGSGTGGGSGTGCGVGGGVGSGSGGGATRDGSRPNGST